MAVESLAVLTPGNYPDDDPVAGLESTLQVFELAERLGYRGAWVRQRHLEHGVSSAAVFLAAASQRTSRIELGTAVIPIGYETPFRLAEDLAMADALSDGRVQAGFSTGMPHSDLLGDVVYDGDWRSYDLGYGRVQRVVGHLSGEYLGGPDALISSPGNLQRPRLQPHRPGLRDRLWYGGTSVPSSRWSGGAGLHLLTGNIVSAAGFDAELFSRSGFGGVQRALIDVYRGAAENGGYPPRRVAVGRVVVPTDSADRATRARYREYEAARHGRTLREHGDRRTIFAPDLVGPVADIAEQIAADPAFEGVTELRLELPYEFPLGDYEQVLTDAVGLPAALRAAA
ncbi:LLM class flavin-dependent oxidoreductase [Tsukamurella sp. 8F]|uniref:LLM class flavin-dependent oxidoreductase n=1 Tax=unclassified Tsukamurella TaxID=2633480 RepID=UPI0023BA06B8|nr:MULTISPECIES: LLM class flavin-dependent oxidoreductase [unclassified Tsukamurella]MDF0530585.1 LLM class flavin-dependent oxidoreductase [Tsukamurella sp. 8J]MDF0586765.1 LLM class flavin-dependent oxidoreductase [Tsukamurella sp. 8F]